MTRVSKPVNPATSAAVGLPLPTDELKLSRRDLPAGDDAGLLFQQRAERVVVSHVISVAVRARLRPEWAATCGHAGLFTACGVIAPRAVNK